MTSRPKLLDFRASVPGDDELQPVVEHVRGGGLVAYPTETVYGFGCGLEPSALARLAELKRREAGHPFLVLIPDASAADSLRWTPEARELASAFWPGAVTLLLSDPLGAFPEGVRSADGAVAVRRSSHPLAKRLVELLGSPLASTSANAPGAEPGRNGEEVYDIALELGAGEEMWVLDGGALAASSPSTIVDCARSEAQVRRAGSTPVRRLRCVIPGLE